MNLAEVHYVAGAIDGEARAEAVVDVLAESGTRGVDTNETWAAAADFKYRYAPALGGAFALATAATLDGTLLAGADDDYDDATGVAVTRFRSDGA